MSKLRRTTNILGGLFLTGFIGYCVYNYGGAEKRMKKMCAEITPGMQYPELVTLSTQWGVTVPQNESGISFLVEKKSFGRWGCKVLLEDGVVTNAEYIFSD